MKKTAFLIIVLALASHLSFAQYIDVPNQTKTQLKSSNNMILGFINPNNFSIQNSFGMSYVSFGSGSASIASYTATLSYKIRDNMHLSADVSMQYSPFASLNSASTSMNKDFQNSLSGVNLSRVSFDYQPFKNMYISFNYYNLKNNLNSLYGNGYNGYYNNPFNRYSGF